MTSARWPGAPLERDARARAGRVSWGIGDLVTQRLAREVGSWAALRVKGAAGAMLLARGVGHGILDNIGILTMAATSGE